MMNRPHVQKLVQRARALPPLRAAFVYPCDSSTLQLALASAFAGILEPVLVGPATRIRDIAAQANIDVSRFPVHDTEDAPRVAAEAAVGLARTAEVAALVKGALGNDDLLAPVAMPTSGLRTTRRLSHAHLVDVPMRAHAMLLADAMLNLQPNLPARRDMLLNTLDLAAAIGHAVPRVALVAGIGVVHPALPSTTDAATLIAMAGEGVFGAVKLEGPMTADAALAPALPQLTASDPTPIDVLLAPAMESASMLLRTLMGLTGALAAGVVLGARVPIIAPLRSDLMETRMASCVLARLYAQWLSRGPAHLAEPKSQATGERTTVQPA